MKIFYLQNYHNRLKYTDSELEKILEKLITSTRSPRGRFSSAASYPQLEKRLSFRHRRLLPRRILAVAATVALLCLSAWMAFNYFQPAALQTISTLAETRTVHLPDGTSVTLNHFTSLSYPEQFESDNRKVTLNGEAYFEVTKDKKHPFIVQTEEINVQVLGTHFNVEAYRNNPEVSTTLLEGSVAVSNKNNSARIILKPNEMAIYNKVEKSLNLKVMKNATDEISWQRGEFIFNHQPLKNITRELSNAFGVTIEIPDTALQNYRITARFPNSENLETILSLLQKAGYFNYSQKGDHITLTAKPDLK